MSVKENIKNKLLNILKESYTEDIDKSVSKKHSQVELPLELSSDNSGGPKTIHVSDIPKARKWGIRENLLEWKNNDFASYLIKSIQKKHADWCVNAIGVRFFIPKVKEDLDNIIGFCDNIVLKDYVDFFIEIWLEHFLLKYSNIIVQRLRYEQVLKDFASKYDYQSSFKKYLSRQKDSKNLKIHFDLEGLNKTYLVGGEALVLSYGLLLPLNWLVRHKGYSKDEAIDYISGAFKKIYKDYTDWKRVIGITEKMNPYPNWFTIKKCDKVFYKLGLDISINIVFEEKKENDIFGEKEI